VAHFLDSELVRGHPLSIPQTGQHVHARIAARRKPKLCGPVNDFSAYFEYSAVGIHLGNTGSRRDAENVSFSFPQLKANASQWIASELPPSLCVLRASARCTGQRELGCDLPHCALCALAREKSVFFVEVPQKRGNVKRLRRSRACSLK
jgi:hypothetical protein